MRSPASTVEPAGTSQRPRFPSAVYIPKDGMTMRCATGSVQLAEKLVYRGHDVRGLRGVEGFENRGERDRRPGGRGGDATGVKRIGNTNVVAGGGVARHRS